MDVIGADIERVDGPLKLTGRATYSGDVTTPHLTHAVMVLSTVASGRVANIASAEAGRMPGVLWVMTHENAPKLPDGGNAGVNPPAGRVLTLMQDDEVRYNRQPIALVVAETLDQAIGAAATIRVSYAEESAPLDFAAARADAHAPKKIQQQPTDSLRGTLPLDAEPQLSALYTTPMQHHNPMEPHATVAYWRGDELTVHDATQYISGCQSTLAKTLGIEKSQVRVICPYVGGGFGCKGSTWSHVPLAAMAARHLARPVKLTLERPQMFGPVGGRPRTEQHLELSADANQRFSGIAHEVFSHTSMFEDFTEPSAMQTRMLYSCANVKTSHRLVRLAVGTPTFQRAPGEATGTFALESAVDELAARLKVDPIELRLRNEPAKDEDKDLPWSSRHLRECFARGAKAFGWDARRPQPRSWRESTEWVGFGVATATYPANRSAASATARLTADGTLVISSGTQDLGTGAYTIMAQVAAQTFGLPLDRVRSELGDSLLPAAPVSGGSQSTASVLPAVEAAVTALREKFLLLAGREEVSRASVAAVLARNGGGDLSASATAQPGAEAKQFSMHSFGAVFAEVRVDTELGILRVPRVVGRYDVGRLINAKTGRSQLLGGVVMGIGMALMEESLLDVRTGRMLNANLAEYHVPTNADIAAIDVEVLGDADPHINSLGARGIGEIGITGVAAAIANGVYNAIGVRVRDLPITPDKLLV